MEVGISMTLTPESILVVAYVLLLVSWGILLYFINYHYKLGDKLMKSVEYWRSAALSYNAKMRRRSNLPAIGGDRTDYNCSICGCETEFEEYAPRDGSPHSDLGLHCLNLACDHREEPIDFYERFRDDG